MNLTRDNRKTLDALSLEVFGTKSRWQKLVNRGYQQPVIKKELHTIPGVDGAPDTTNEVDTPVVLKSGGSLTTIKYHTPESIEAVMLDLKEQKQKWMEMVAKAQAEQKAKSDQEALQKQIQEELGGSAT